MKTTPTTSRAETSSSSARPPIYGDAQWTSEVWSKGSKAKSKKALNQAVEAVLDRGGSYIGVTATPLVGDKLKNRAKAIRQGIEVAGGDPGRLHTVEVYDGNKLAAWASVHPAVALWVKEQAKVPLAGFPPSMGQKGRYRQAGLRGQP